MSKRTAGKNDEGKKKNKQQAASLARRMAGKKGQTTQLQIEVNNQEDWNNLVARDGVIVIDVYSDWSGPCVGMVGNLKKAKVEIGGDSFLLAVAKNDEIDCLARFRNRSEPTWLFVAGGLLVTCMFGANAPKLMSMIDSHVKAEARVMRGETFRTGVPFTELCEEEKKILAAKEKLRSEAQRLEDERRAAELERKRLKLYQQMGEQLTQETVFISFPHTVHPETGCVLLNELDLILHSQGMHIAQQHKMSINKELLEEICFNGSLEITDDLLEDLSLGPCVVLLLKSQIKITHGQEDDRQLGEIEKEFCEALYMVRVDEHHQRHLVPDPSSLPAKYPYIRRIKQESAEGEEEEEEIEEETSVPGCWSPADYITKCAAVRYLFPSRAEKVMMPDSDSIPRVVLGFDLSKQKECFDIMEEYQDDILNYGYFSGVTAQAEHLCATPDQYAKLQHADTNRLIIVVKKMKSEPLLTFAGLGAVYVSPNETVGMQEADRFFPPGVEPRFYRLEAAEREEREAKAADQAAEDEGEEEGEEEETGEQDEEDLMALLGVVAEGAAPAHKEVAKVVSKDIMKDPSRDVTKEIMTEPSKEISKATSKDITKDPSKEVTVTKDVFADATKDGSKEIVKGSRTVI